MTTAAGGYDDLVVAGGVATEESVVADEEADGVSMEGAESGRGEVGRWLERAKVTFYLQKAGVFEFC